MQMATIQTKPKWALHGEADAGKVETYLLQQGFEGITVSIDSSEGYVTVGDPAEKYNLDEITRALKRYEPILTPKEQARELIMVDETLAYEELLATDPEDLSTVERAVLAMAVRLGLILTD